MRYTKGPWQQHQGYIFGKDGIKNGNLIAQVCDRAMTNRAFARAASQISIEESNGNADLIIAAPELYEVLKRVADNNAALGHLPLDILANIHQAIAKAEGRK